MNIYFDKYNQPEQPKVYVGTPNNEILCALNGIDENSFSLTQNLNNTWDLSFDVDKYINIEGIEVESSGYSFLCVLLRLYVEDIGWFLMTPPTTTNTGYREYKTVNASSAEIEMMQHDIKSLKINRGTTDSYEMLVEGNVDKVGEVEFAKEQIKFYNQANPELSFLDIILKVSNMHGWTIGYIDNIPKTYKYYENGELKEKHVVLSDEIGTFDIESQDLYSFLTQDAAQFFSCLFFFDFKKFEISAYRPENIGQNTNINISLRNLQQSNEISVEKDDIYTRYYVTGGNGLNITYVNFGDNRIENLDYFKNQKYMSAELIKKYNLWEKDVEKNRVPYIENTRQYNKQLSVISELKNRVPLDDCSTDWSRFSDEKLLEAQANYKSMLKGYEEFYVDSQGNFDEEALKNSPDADSYYQVRDVILPSIQIEIDNRNLPEGSDKGHYVESYKTDWKLYGLDELDACLANYKKNKQLAEDAGCTEPYDPETSKNTEDHHNKMYELYKEAVKQLDPNQEGSCQQAYNQRKAEVEAAEALLEQYDNARKECMERVEKETWSNTDTGEVLTFSDEDLACLSRLYVDCDYTNENMFLTASDDSVTAIDEQLKLLDAAKADLEIASQPQYIYTTSLDNFLAKYDYKNYTDNLNLGDFIYLSTDDNNAVKLRVVSISYNPLRMDNGLSITFSNMVRSRSKRDDFAYLLNSSNNRSKTASSGGSNGFTQNGGMELTPELIQKLLRSSAFLNKIDQIIQGNIGGITIGNGSISLNELNAKMIKVIDLFAENGFFEYLQAKLISVDKIVADSGTFDKLEAKVGIIDDLLAGTISGELGHIIHLTAENVQIDEAVIRDLIAANITVSMLQAGEINADKFNIKSEDGGLEIVGNTMQFKDASGNVRIQIGRDTNNNFNFVLYDETGKGVLIDSSGIRESAIKDGLIKTDMIANGAVTEEKIDKTDMREWTDESGNKIFDVSKLYYGNDKFEVSYTQTVQKVNDLEGKVGSIELSGEQIFKSVSDKITPSSITVTARCRNGISVGNWYIDDVLNTDYVSADKNSITIPSSFMSPDNEQKKNTATIKVVDSTGKLYDLHTIYLLDDLVGAEGQPAISVIITSEKGNVFNEDTTITETLCDCTVYEGRTEILPLSYEWQIIDSDNGNWVTIGHERTQLISLDPSVIRKRVRCLVNVESSTSVYLTDENGNYLKDESGSRLYMRVENSKVSDLKDKNINTVDTINDLTNKDSIFVNDCGRLKQINYDILSDFVLDKIKTKTYSEIGNKNILTAILEAAGIEITSEEIQNAFMSILNEGVK